MILGTFDLLVIIVLSLILVYAGLHSYRQGEDIKAYVNAGNKASWITCGISAFMSFFSAGTFVVWGALAYDHGIVAITIQETICIAGLLSALFIIPVWKKTGSSTISDYLAEKFGDKAQHFYCTLFFFLSFFSAASFLYPIGSMLATASGLQTQTCIIILGSLTVIYSALGGMKAVLTTDILKFAIFAISILIVVPLALMKSNGVTGLMASLPEGFKSATHGEYNWLFIISFGLYNMVRLSGDWSLVQKFNATPSPADATKSGLLFAVLYLISPFLWMIPCMAAHADGLGLGVLSGESAFVSVCHKILCPGLTGFMLAGLIFTSLSSITALMTSAASSFANDFMRRQNPGMSERKVLKTARITAIVFGAISIALALMVPSMGGIVNLIISLAALTGAPMFLPVIWSIFSKSQTSKSMIAVTSISLVINIFCKFALQHLTGIALSRAWEMCLGVMLPVALLTIIELYNKLHIYKTN